MLTNALGSRALLIERLLKAVIVFLPRGSMISSEVHGGFNNLCVKRCSVMSKPREAKKEMVPDPRREEADQRLRCLSHEALNGDQRAAQELWRQVRLLTYKLARILAKRHRIQEADVDDIVQDAILRLCRLPTERFHEILSWNAFLFIVVKRCAINRHLQQRRRSVKEVSLTSTLTDGEESNKSLQDLIAGSVDVCPEVDARELAEACGRFLVSLPKEEAEVFCLYQERESQKEIASRLGMTTGRVNMIIFKTKKKMIGWLRSMGFLHEDT